MPPEYANLLMGVGRSGGTLKGTNSHVLLFGLVLFSGTLGGSAGPLLAGFLFDQTGTYQIVLIV
jgi:hypothetical protein